MSIRTRRWVVLSLAAILLIVCFAIPYSKHRALVRQPGDYIKGVLGEMRDAKSIWEGFGRALDVTDMFWNCWEVRMSEGRVWSGLPFYQEPTDEPSASVTNQDDVEITIEWDKTKTIRPAVTE